MSRDGWPGSSTFLLEADRLKQVERQTVSSAERVGRTRPSTPGTSDCSPSSWPSTPSEPVDLTRVLAMVLVHDLVEIDAGDTFAYDKSGDEDQGGAGTGGR